ncbi:MAG: amidohydrolase family protein [Prolixibacteraceae bacterium]
MRKISAHLIIDGLGNCFPKGILSVDQSGRITDIVDTKGILNESAEVEFYSGVIVPGFVNAHCHLELSHLKDAFSEGGGMVPFLKKVVKSRASEPERIIKSTENADLMMFKEGIVAVGDISNETSSFEIKSQSKIDYFTFIEILGFDPDRAVNAFERAMDCLKSAENLGLKASIVPHAPYSVSTSLFNAISSEARKTGSPISYHSQESTEEDELYLKGSGDLFNLFRDDLGINTSSFKPTGKGALQSTLKYFPEQNNLLLIHNLYTNQSDLDYIASKRKLSNTWFVLCPGSNLFIQNKLPDIALFRNNHLQICLGTDSLVSNHQLSILEEMKILQNFFPSITLEEMTGWATFNGANALGINEWAGSIEVGKRPGINLLTGLDIVGKKLLPGTKVKKLC